MSVLLISDDAVKDHIGNVLTQRPRGGFEQLSLSQFLWRCGVRVNSQGRLVIDATDPMSMTIIDRVVEISSTTVSAVGGASALLHRGQVYSAYEQLLCKETSHRKSTQYTLLGRLLPLTTQWLLVNRALPQIGIPEFRSGYGPERVQAKGLTDPIFKSPFDLYSWRPNERPDEVVWDDFIVSRPVGRPILTYRLTDRTIIEALDHDVSFTGHEALLEIVFPKVLELFEAAVGEALWFGTGGQLTFAAFSHSLSGAAKSERFTDEADAYLQSFVSQ